MRGCKCEIWSLGRKWEVPPARAGKLLTIIITIIAMIKIIIIVIIFVFVIIIIIFVTIITAGWKVPLTNVRLVLPCFTFLPGSPIAIS